MTDEKFEQAKKLTTQICVMRSFIRDANAVHSFSGESERTTEAMKIILIRDLVEQLAALETLFRDL